MHDNHTDSEAGYTLLETLVAFVILSMSVTAFFQAWSVSSNSARRAADQSSAVAVADSLLNRIGTSDLPLRPGIFEANEAELPYWRVEIEPYASAPDGGTHLFMVRMTVSDSRGSTPLLDIDTLRLLTL
ncbi:prepilin-type N-terminal cleavage/methylation domain-containing protein [Hyphomonas sp.]|uniref:type IV pilus modification PilV family protein n=1 Tax=Hyphomonas sp. TaxID=87 RepID=UPI003527B0A9